MSAVAKFEAAVNRGERAGCRAAGLALARLAAAAPPRDPALPSTLEVRGMEVRSNTHRGYGSYANKVIKRRNRSGTPPCNPPWS